MFEYLPPHSVLVDVNDAAERCRGLWNGIVERHEQLRHDRHRPILDPAEVYLTPGGFLRGLRGMAQGPTAHLRMASGNRRPDAKFSERGAGRGTHRCARRTAGGRIGIAHRGEPVRASCWPPNPPAGANCILDLLRGRGVQPKVFDGFASFLASGSEAWDHRVGRGVGPHAGDRRRWRSSPNRSYSAIARGQERRRRRAERDPAKILKELSDLRIGAPVVHETYGVGRYVGLQTMDVAGYTGEFLVLEYADGDKLYVPVQALHLVSRYTGAPAETAPLHKLGGDQWQKARRKAAQRIRDVAAELLDLYSRRAARQGTRMLAGEAEYRAFQAGFPFEETADQAAAIEQVIADLKSDKPMDRVICGDVGFGKTEVALRAAFVAVQAGKQVAVLVPTTLLAQQHYHNLRRPLRRLASTHREPVALSNQQGSGGRRQRHCRGQDRHRHRHAASAAGKVRFKDLGLVVIDEEHRFGVRDKEKLKALRTEVDVLTLTATPIPRTLNMAMGGLRDLSLITTPPAERLAVKTFVLEWNERWSARRYCAKFAAAAKSISSTTP